MMIFSYRQTNVWAALFCAACLIMGFVLQKFYGMLPCPLCIFQRWIFIVLLMIFLIGSLCARTPFQGRLFGALTLLFSLKGLFLSGRHLWLLHHPPEANGVCTPNIFYLFKQKPFIEALQTLFWGSGDCATMAESFLGISMPSWTLLGFFILTCFSLWQIARKSPATPRW